VASLDTSAATQFLSGKTAGQLHSVSGAPDVIMCTAADDNDWWYLSNTDCSDRLLVDVLQEEAAAGAAAATAQVGVPTADVPCGGKDLSSTPRTWSWLVASGSGTAATGSDPSLPTLFIAEGFVYYLPGQMPDLVGCLLRF